MERGGVIVLAAVLVAGMLLGVVYFTAFASDPITSDDDDQTIALVARASASLGEETFENKMTVNVGQTVSFSGIDSNGSVSSYSWRITQLGNTTFDGSMSGPTASFKFSIPGEFKVKLTISNSQGESDSDDFRVYVGLRSEHTGTLTMGQTRDYDFGVEWGASRIIVTVSFEPVRNTFGVNAANLDLVVLGADGEVAGESDEPIEPNAQELIIEEVEISPMQWIHAHGTGSWQATIECSASGLSGVPYTVLVEVHY